MQEKIAKFKKLKLLFVEDEEDLIEIITGTLDKLGSKYLTAKNGKEALEVIDSHDDIDMVITDLNMPVMNGIDMIKVLKQTHPSLPIIIMSAHTEQEYIDKAKELGVSNYLLKPFDFMKFIKLISQMDIK